MRIILVGFMGVGKTTLGKKIASRLNFDFVDLDKYIEHKHKVSISYIFNLIGEKGFRTIEQRSLFEIIEKDNIVLSTGGGTPCFFDNMNLLNQNGITIYLSLPSKALLNRLINSKKKRPLIQNLDKNSLLEYIELKFSERKKYYREAKIKIDVLNFSIDEIVDIIKKYIQDK